VTWLARLKNEKALETPAREPSKPGCLGFLAPVPALTRKSQEADEPAQAVGEGAAEPDRWCWPHSPAMNSGELDAFAARLARFTDRGLRYDHALRLVDRLVVRDREGDDRRLCLECGHLQGAGRWRCGDWRRAEVSGQGLATELMAALQRCPAFRAAHEGGRSNL
jgi:hypothetical protein